MLRSLQLAFVLVLVAVAAQAGVPGRGVPAKPVSSAPAPPPDAAKILAGGDTCATATVIPSLPYSDNGTTAGFSNDYNEDCPFTGSTAPDVVYSYSPAADVLVDIDLCTGPTEYDTKVFVYEDACPGTVAGCNDDACESSFPAPFVSRLAFVPLTGGHTYYIVVDGYDGGSAGVYYLDVDVSPPPPACDPTDLLHGQPPELPTDQFAAYVSGSAPWEPSTTWDDFDGTNLSITGLAWWGLSVDNLEGWVACDPTGVTYDVRFFDDSAGQPGAEICAYPGVSPSFAFTGFYYDDAFELVAWQLDLAPACEPTGVAWVSVKTLANADNCNLAWMSGTGGDGAAWQVVGAPTRVAIPDDLAFCLHGVAVPVELQSLTAE